MNKNIAIKIQNVSKIYKLYNKPIDRVKESLNPFKKSYHKDFYALKNINLEIKKGEVLGIVGVNGAGKSTLLKIITGVLTPTIGQVYIDGKINAILELGGGFKPEMTGLENIKLNLQINQTVNKKLLNEVIEFADIGIYINQPIKTYSSGMKARLGFALAIMTEPDILIVDEALSVGDAAFKLKSYEKMKSLMHNGCTVLYVSHSLQSVIQLCTRAILLVDHTIVETGSPKDIIEEYQHRLFSSNKNIELIEKKKEKRKNNFKKGSYSQELVTKPKILQNYNVYIENAKILDKNNLIVNILETGKDYTITFNVIFKESFSNVMFGIQFKTLNGIFLYSPRDEEYFDTEIKKNTTLNVTFQFNNTLLENTYYLTLGSATVINGEIKYLVEHTETLIFKVLKLSSIDKLSEFGLIRINGKMETRLKVN